MWPGRFCLMLISRGPVYRSEDTAGAGSAYHDHCDCRIVPVFGDAVDWPGRAEHERAEDFYRAALRWGKRQDPKITDPVRAMRRYATAVGRGSENRAA